MDNNSTPKQRAEQAYDAFYDFINDMGCDIDTFTDKMANAHKTLQQKAYTLVSSFIKKMAEKEGWQIDPRNEYSVAQCKKMIDAIGGNTSAPLI